MIKKISFLVPIFILSACTLPFFSTGEHEQEKQNQQENLDQEEHNQQVNNDQDEEQINFEGDKYIDKTPSETKDGNIFHAFCWRYTDITVNLPSIAESSFKSIQISPVQQPKNGGATWWSFYQPLSFSIADNSSLGTKEELTTLCEEAAKYDISIIADIVFNHLANIDDDHLEADGTPMVSPEVELYEPEIYAKRNASGSEATFHHNKNASGSGAVTQYYQWGQLPDLNTANPLVQQRSLDLLKECIDVGIDGFRLDAAKHIETPTDPQYASDFFPNVINAAKDYYKTVNGNKDLYVYGEILDNPDGGRTINDYLPYIDVTDNKVKSSYISATIRKNATVLPTTNYSKQCDSDHIVYWAESHDDYTSGETLASSIQVNKAWAMMSSRKGGRGLYLARQAVRDNVVVGEVGSYLFEHPSVGAANRFHNRFVGAEESVSAQDSIFICERYNSNDQGAMVVELMTNATEEKTSITFTKLDDGYYCDQMTGKIVKLSNHKAEIELHSSHIAVLTKTKNVAHPYLTVSNRGGYFVGTANVELNLADGEGTYQINERTPVTFTGKTLVKLTSEMAIADDIKLTIKYGNEQFSFEREYTYSPVAIKEGYFNVLNLNSTYFTDYEVYLWSWNGTTSRWSKDYTVEDGVMLINLATFPEPSFLIALFPKDYVIPNMNAWDNNKIKQTGDISISSKFYDASNF